MNICTYNTRTLHEEHMDNFVEELEQGLEWDIIGLSETKLTGSFTETVKYGHEFFNSGVPSGRRQSGVGFIVQRQHKDKIIEFNPVSERLAFLKVKGETIRGRS